MKENKEGYIIYTSSKHIESIRGNGGIEHLKQVWEKSLGKKVKIEDNGRTLTVRPLRGRNRLGV